MPCRHSIVTSRFSSISSRNGGIISVEEGLEGFANEGLITVLVLFVVVVLTVVEPFSLPPLLLLLLSSLLLPRRKGARPSLARSA